MARIRSIKPEFFTSKTLAALPWRTRLTFIGLWTHCDDYGRCQDDATLIRAALFIRDDDVRDADVEADLHELEMAGLITRYRGHYRAKDRALLQINSWPEHQRVQHPSKSSIPAPEITESSRESPESLMSPHEDDVSPTEPVMTGAVELGEQRSIGTRSKPLVTADAATVATPDHFDEFWAVYPRKHGKQAARKAWAKAIKRQAPEFITERAAALAADPNLPEQRLIPHASTWLNGERWHDPPYPPRQTPSRSDDVLRREMERAHQSHTLNLPALGA